MNRRRVEGMGIWPFRVRFQIVENRGPPHPALSPGRGYRCASLQFPVDSWVRCANGLRAFSPLALSPPPSLNGKLPPSLNGKLRRDGSARQGEGEGTI